MKIAGITQKGLVALSLAGAAMASVHANELYVEPTGVGIGVATPDRLLHLRGPNAVFRMDRPADTAAFIIARTDSSYNPMKVYVVGVNASAPGNGEFMISDLGASTSGASARRMTITSGGETHFTGVVRAPAFAQTSSIRFKSDVLTLANPIESLKQLRGVKFNWKETGAPSIGLIAEEVVKVYPELVEMDGAVPGAVNYSAMVAVLLEAVKQQDEEIHRQKIELEKIKRQTTMANAAEVEKRLVALEAAYTQFLSNQSAEAKTALHRVDFSVKE
ncbi:tail fiber domain-containing protein [Hydrogenophaga taeniospiralis]|jgi:hypothetical protein|uniref:tail fiber domain-containing protein n=1 Tax=Hydrogenophaga taeniospiralis TaxID=65656 RepID=UPI001CF9EFEA|nr:tail fiber domain-containing protein [Hydrogenophaga taeniospiralis]MCB4366223.1 tail fiber domain-containing protein [Hydrogenophaga taeniospiralis]